MDQDSRVSLTMSELDRLRAWVDSLSDDTIRIEIVQEASNGIGSVIKVYSIGMNGRGGSWTEISDVGEW